MPIAAMIAVVCSLVNSAWRFLGLCYSGGEQLSGTMPPLVFWMAMIMPPSNPLGLATEPAIVNMPNAASSQRRSIGVVENGHALGYVVVIVPASIHTPVAPANWNCSVPEPVAPW